MTNATTDPHENDLVVKIDDLVTKLDDVIKEVRDQREKAETETKRREQLTIRVGVALVLLSLLVLGGALYTSHRVDSLAKKREADNKHATCSSQNVTRKVVHDLLTSAQTELNASKPPPNLNDVQLQQYNDQVAKAKQFYANQIAKVAPLKC